MKKVYNIKEVEELFKVSRITIYKYIKHNELEGIKIGREWRFTEEAIADFLKRGTSDDYRKATIRKDRLKPKA